MNQPTNNHARVLLALFTLALLSSAQDQPTIRDDDWHRKELSRAKRLIREQHDFSPIHEAFAAKDVVLLWHYYTISFGIPMHRFNGRGMPISPTDFNALSAERQAAIRLNREQIALASSYLKQIPGHARLYGDAIEETFYGRAGGGEMRNTMFACLGTLGMEGSDECIEQLGRYLFDARDPGFHPFDPAQPKLSLYDTRGVRNPIRDKASSALLGILKERFSFAKVLVGEEGIGVKGYEDKIREWWLTSAEAAPYRRSLASTGVVLPPGYPPMKELEGTKTTIAPPLKNPPYPDGVSPPSSTPPDPTAKP